MIRLLELGVLLLAIVGAVLAVWGHRRAPNASTRWGHDRACCSCSGLLLERRRQWSEAVVGFSIRHLFRSGVFMQGKRRVASFAAPVLFTAPTLSAQAAATVVRDSAKQSLIHELRQIVAFYHTPAGQNLIAELPGITLESMQAGQAWGAQIGKSVAEQLAKGAFAYRRRHSLKGRRAGHAGLD